MYGCIYLQSKEVIINMRFIVLSVLLSLLWACGPSSQPSSHEVVNSQMGAYDPEAKLAAMGITLNEPTPPVANYVHTVRTGNLVFVSGKGPQHDDGSYIEGIVGKDLTVEEGYAAARLTGIQSLASLKAELGNLNRVKRVVKVLGMVNSVEGFRNQPQVINGFSDLMVEVFGDRGKHARSAVGMGSLPSNIAVEIEVIVEVE